MIQHIVTITQNGDCILAEAYDTETDARERLGTIYRDHAQEGDPDLISAEWSENQATVRSGNGITVIRIHQSDTFRKWREVHWETSKNPAFADCDTGLLSNGEDFLHFVSSENDETSGRTYRVFGSTEDMMHDDPLCEFDETQKNTKLLLTILSTTDFNRIYDNRTCDQSRSLLRTIKFPGK